MPSPGRGLNTSTESTDASATAVSVLVLKLWREGKTRQDIVIEEEPQRGPEVYGNFLQVLVNFFHLKNLRKL